MNNPGDAVDVGEQRRATARYLGLDRAPDPIAVDRLGDDMTPAALRQGITVNLDLLQQLWDDPVVGDHVRGWLVFFDDRLAGVVALLSDEADR